MELHQLEYLVAVAEDRHFGRAAAIGAGPPSWTVVYASHAARLQTSPLAFLPFRESDRLSLTTFLVTRLQDPTPHLDLLLKACAANDHDS